MIKLIRPATIAVAVAVALMWSGVAVGAYGGCTGGSTGFCAPSRDRAPLVWWDLGRHDVDMGLGQAEAYASSEADPTGPVVLLGHGSVSVRVGTVELGAYLAAVPPIVSAGKVLRSVCVARLSPLRCPNG